MLAANKDLLLAGAAQQAKELRKLELDTVVTRYSQLLTVSSISSGFAFSGLVEFEVPGEDDLTAMPTTRTMVALFYASATSALILGIYVTAVSTFLIGMGYRLAMQGDSHSSLDRATATLTTTFPIVVRAGGLALVALLLAAFAMVWIKCEASVTQAAWIGTTMIGVGTLLTCGHMGRLYCVLNITGDLVTGDVPIAAGSGTVDLEDVVEYGVDYEAIRGH